MTTYRVEVPDRMFAELPLCRFEKIRDWGNRLSSTEDEVHFWKRPDLAVICFETENSDLAMLLTSWVDQGWEGVKKFAEMKGLTDG